MAFKERGPRDWWPGMKPGVVKSDIPGEELRMGRARPIKSYSDLPKYPDFRSNADKALYRREPVELYVIWGYREGQKTDRVGNLLWFPKAHRAGIVFKEDMDILDGAAQWTDAANPLEALERWVADELTDQKREWHPD